MPRLQALYDDYHDQGFEVITVNLQEPISTVKLYARQYSYLFLLDQDASTWWLYRKDGYIPLNYVIDNDQNMTVAHGREGWNEGVMRYFIEQCLEGVEEEEAGIRHRASGIRLLQNAPNPFGTGGTAIKFSVSDSKSPVSLKVYDLGGRLVSSLVDGLKEPGNHTAHWDGKDLDGREVKSGVYFYRLTAGDCSACRKLTVLR